MSVYGGDSWGREAQNRKRRVDDLLLDSAPSSSYKKLSNGKLSCLICPNCPVLDSPLMLSMHQKGSRHLAAVAELKARENRTQYDIDKRMALSGSSTVTSSSTATTQNSWSSSKPLMGKTHQASSQIVCKETLEQNSATEINAVKLNDDRHTTQPSNPDIMTKERKIVVLQESEFLERREKELKFTAAGWKRDCHGKWFKDDNVEFDSDEEDPNVCLALA